MATHTVGPYCRVCLTKNNFQKPFKTMQYVIDVTELILPGMSLYLKVNKDSLVCDKCYFFLLAIENYRTQVIESQRLHWSNGIMSCGGCCTNNLNFQKFLSTVNSYSSICVKPAITTDIKPPRKKIIINKALKVSDLNSQKRTGSVLKKSSKPESTEVKKLRAKRIKKDKVIKSKCDVGENVIINDLTDISAIPESEPDLLSFKEFIGNKNESAVNVLSNIVLRKQHSRSTVDQTIEKVLSASSLKKSSDSNEYCEKSNNNTVENNDDSNDCVTITINDVCESQSSNEDVTFVSVSMVSSDEEKQHSRESVIVSSIPDRSSDHPIIKTEVVEDENPGFFNRKDGEGYYKCRFCHQKYKTSLGLYQHTQKKHKEMKIHHCSFCNFFSLWKSALVRHTSMYHSEHFEDPSQQMSCYHCSYTSFNKKELGEHILRKHVSNPVTCAICSEHFLNSDACDEHVSSVHMLNVQGNVAENSEVCGVCNKIVDCEAYEVHNREVHGISNI